MNILLVFTGGTIGSISRNGSINTSDKQNYQLIHLFKHVYSNSESLNFTTIQPLELLSENLFPSDWEVLIEAIEAKNISQYDGVIVTHGTDTLAYSAAALSFYFNQIAIPILLVSSDFPLEHPRANGLHNFHCAIEFIKQKKQIGVFVPYKNENENVLVHLGSRLASSLQLTGDFISVQSKAYLQFQQNTFEQLNVANFALCEKVQIKPIFSSRILLIRPYPGLDYSNILLDHVDAVMHDLYHSGTACSSHLWGENHSLVIFIKRCEQQNIKIYMAPAIHYPDTYQSTQLLIEHGARMIWNMSIEAAYVKLLLAYGNFDEPLAIEQFLKQDIALEHL